MHERASSHFSPTRPATAYGTRGTDDLRSRATYDASQIRIRQIGQLVIGLLGCEGGERDRLVGAVYWKRSDHATKMRLTRSRCVELQSHVVIQVVMKGRWLSCTYLYGGTEWISPVAALHIKPGPGTPECISTNLSG